MKNKNLEILKLFTRKLANCKYNVPAEKLVGYLKDGTCGYKFDKNGDNFVTNDFVFSEEIAKVVSHIRAIFEEPHISLKQEDVVRNVSVATEYDNRSLDETIRDEKLWRVRRNEAKPEFIHSYVREENLAIYENRFISYLVDFLYEQVSKKLSAMIKQIATFNKKINENEEVPAYPQSTYLGYTENVERIPVLADGTDPQIKAMSSLYKSKALLNSFKSYEMYVACKKESFDIKSLMPTNILLVDNDYNYCYKFYVSYLKSKDFYTTQSKMYSAFTIVNLISAINECGFEFASGTQNIFVNELAEISLESVKLKNDVFELTVSQIDDDALLTVTDLIDKSKAKYLFKIVSSSKKAEMGGRTPEEYAAYLNENKEAGILRVIVVTDIETDNAINTVYLTADSPAAVANLITAIKSLTILLEGVEFIHSRHCPVCGTTLIAPEEGDFFCSNCGTKYHIFRFSNRDYIWLKLLPEVKEKKAQTNDEIIVEQPAEDKPAVSETPIEEEPAVSETPIEKEPVAEETSEDVAATDDTALSEDSLRRVVQKSFIGKLSQASKEQKEFYNELKNYILAYKRINSRISWNFDSFNIGRDKVVRIAFRGLTMVAYLALNPEDYADTKYYPHDMGDKKKFEDTPMMVKIKSERGVKFAKELIDIICKDLPAKKNFEPEVYKFPYMSDKKLIENGLAKETFVKL